MSMKNRIKIIRKNLKLSQEEFADICGISRVQVTRLETGTRRLSMENAALYADRLAALGHYFTPIEFFVDINEVGFKDEQEKELLETFRGLSDKERSEFLSMGESMARGKSLKSRN